jgi:heme/copper-type cytochrome/quinol oxidase subunit 3
VLAVNPISHNAAQLCARWIGLAVVAVKAWQGAYSAETHTGVETGASCWHTVDLVWIVVFSPVC